MKSVETHNPGFVYGEIRFIFSSIPYRPVVIKKAQGTERSFKRNETGWRGNTNSGCGVRWID